MYIKYACWQALIMACMRARRSFLLAAAGAMTLGVLPNAFAQYAATVVVYKSPTCGCCGEWEKHMRAAGFRLDTRPTSDMAAVKDGLGVPEALRSCHTATLGGYVFEGHAARARQGDRPRRARHAGGRAGHGAGTCAALLDLRVRRHGDARLRTPLRTAPGPSTRSVP
jgi:hypothetical protein